MKLHAGASCVTGTLRPPIHTVPERESPEFEPTVIRTFPPPDTLDGLTAEIRLPLSDTSQLHTDGPSAVTDLVPPAASKRTDGGDTSSGEGPH